LLFIAIISEKKLISMFTYICSTYIYLYLQYLYVQTVFGPNLGALIFGSTMLVGAILAYFLPETNNQKLPENIAEANVFMTGK